MPRHTSSSWLDVVNDLITGRVGHGPHAPFRRLLGERLENRMVLSGAPIESSYGETLAEYLEHDAAMGPIAPAEVSAVPAADDQQSAVDLAPISIDQYFDYSQGAGRGEGEGSGSGSGSGSGQGSGSGSGQGSGSGSGQTSGSGSGQSSGSGSGQGSGSGSGSNSGGGGEAESEEPVISDAEVDSVDGQIIVTGSLDDNGGLEGLSMSLDGGVGTITINEDGTFQVNITDPQGNTTFTITVTDADGNSTTFTFDYNP